MEYSYFQFWPIQSTRRTPSERIRYIRENSLGGRQPDDIGVTHEQQVQKLKYARIV